jgi:dihydroflavonol-4-reductase
LPEELRDVYPGMFARAHLRAATGGRPGERYIVGGTNVTYPELYRGLATASRRRALPIPVPPPVGWAAAAVVEVACRLIGRRPPVTLAMAREILGRFSFCDTTKARLQLGHAPRPLGETLRDTVAWFRSHPVG